MRQPRTFLVIAEDPQRLLLISTTLHRKFPNSVVQTCRDSEAAIGVASTTHLDAIITTQSSDLDPVPLVEQLRAASTAPIVAMAAPLDEPRALAAGASRFLHHEQWLLIGTTVGELLGARPAES